MGTYTYVFGLYYSYSGGICAYSSDSSISYCYNTGIVSSKSYNNSAGGICAHSLNSSIFNCYNTGRISSGVGSDSYSGGVCAYSYKSFISNCYNTGNISGDFIVGTSTHSSTAGICGDNCEGNISKCFAANETVLGSYSGRIATGEIDNYSGDHYLESCYAQSLMLVNGKTISSQDPTDRHGKDADFSDFQSQSWIEENLNWDFNTDWEMSDINSPNQGLPILRQQYFTAIPTISTENKQLHNIRYFNLQGKALSMPPVGEVFVESGENSYGKIVSRKKFIKE
jgi:hypothetical protein